MAYDLEEQEKIASLKAWWERYGTVLTTAALVVAIGFAGWQFWRSYQVRQSAEASAAYDQLQRAATAKDPARVKEFAGVLLDKYGSSGFAQMGALVAAKANLEGGDAKTAKAQLQWAAEHAVDPEYRAIARLRLAGVLLDEGLYDEASAQVASATANDLSIPMQAAFADRRGDIALARGKGDDAAREYRAAIASLEGRPEGRGYANVIQLKLDAVLGGTPAVVPTPVADASQNDAGKPVAKPAEKRP